MKRKILIFTILVCIMTSLSFIYKAYTNHDDYSGAIYNSVYDFEADTNIRFYDLYDCESFITKNEKKLIRSIKSNLKIYQSKHFYTIEIDNPSNYYMVTFAPPFEENLEECEKYELMNGILYIFSGENKSNIYSGVFFKEDLKYRFSFNNEHYNLKADVIISKLIDYVKIVETYNQMTEK